MRAMWKIGRRKREMSLGRAVVIGSALLGALITLRSLPDLRRYLRIERM